jgi:hypothetical protein
MIFKQRMCTFSGDIIFSNDLFSMLASQRVSDCVIDFSLEVLSRNCDCERRQFENSPRVAYFSRFLFLPVKFALPLVVSPAQYTTNLLGAFSLSRVEFQTLKVGCIRRLRRHRPTRLISNQSALITNSQVRSVQSYNTLRMRCLLALDDCNVMNY